jgi:hypothetical protein
VAAEGAIAAFPEAKSSVEAAAVTFEEKAAASSIPNLAVTLEREKTRDGFATAKATLATADQKCNVELAAILKKDSSDDEQLTKTMTAACLQFQKQAKSESALPGAQLAEWEALTTAAHEKLAAAQTQVGDSRVFLEGQLGKSGTLTVVLKDRMREYPTKQSDIVARVADIAAERDAMGEALTAAETHTAALTDDTGGYDVALFAAALAEINEADETARLAVVDLTERAVELGELYALVLTRLERTCTFKLHSTKWSWGSETYGDGTPSDMGWRDVGEAEWFATAEDAVVSSNGSDYYAGDQTEIDDKEIVCSHRMTTYEIKDGLPQDAVITEVDEDMFEDYYSSARSVADLFPDAGIIRNLTVSPFTDPEDLAEVGNPYSPVPVGVDMSLDLVIESKAKGQYEDEATEAPAPLNVPVQYVGNVEYGEWRNDGLGNRSWHWNEFALGYLLAGGFNTSPYPYSAHAPYSSWRNAGGWDCPPDQRDENGNCQRRYHGRGYYRSYYRTGSYYDGDYRSDYRAVPGRSTTSTSHSVRGAGPSARARGMGVGGK